MTARAWFRLHSFTGVITGLLLFVICWSGSFATLAHEIDWLVTPELRVDRRGQWASWGEWLAAVEQAYPQARLRWITAPLYSLAVAQAVVDLPAQDHVRIHIDPYGARVQGLTGFFNVQRFFRDFHRRLFYPNPWGLYVVTAFNVAMLVSLVAALGFYRRWWSRFLHFRPGRGRALWSELHKTAGLWSLWFVLVIGLTSVWYLFEGLRGHVGDGIVAYAGTASFARHRIPGPASSPAAPPLPLDALIERVRERRPGLAIRTVSPRFSHDGALYVDGQAGHLLVRDRANQVHLDTRTGAVLYSQSAGALPLYWRWVDSADPLHFGDFAGLVSKLIWFVAGLVLCGLILTGTYLHARRLAHGRSGERHRWPGTAAALLVSLAVLAGSLPLGWEAAGGDRGAALARAAPATIAPGAQAVIVAWILLTLAILAVWVRLLWRAPSA